MSTANIRQATEMCKDHAIAKFAFVTFKLTSVSTYTTLSLLLLDGGACMRRRNEKDDDGVVVRSR